MAANFIDHKLSARVSREFRRIATGKTEITPLKSGDEDRRAVWKYKKMRFVASFVLLSPEAQNEITSAFYAADAMRLLFRFRDAGDFKVEASPLVGVVPETTGAVQLTKRYSFGPAYADRVIQAVDSCQVHLADGTPVAGTVDDALGLFVPSSPWDEDTNYYWTGRFSCWVRFASDDFDMTLKDISLATSDVELIEQKARRT